jgi:hypothetical protein
MSTYLKPAKINWINVKRYLQGWKRYFLYRLTQRKHLLGKVADTFPVLSQEKKEQFEWRLIVMNEKCLQGGACIICGCDTPQLQMIDEACEGKCYPDMMDKETWRKYKEDNSIVI